MKLLFLLMAYLNQYAQITIGQLLFKNISEFEVVQTVTEISDKATITLPRHYKLLDGKKVNDYIKAGDEVIINAGYNGELFTEYKGFVSQAPTADVPVVIECDELYPLRRGNIIKSYPSITLKKLLTNHLPGYTIECPNVELGKMYLDHVSPYQMLEDLRKNFGFFAKVYNDNILHVGWAYDWNPGYTKEVEYIFGESIKSAAGLKFKHKTDFATKVKLTIIKPDGLKEEVEYGSKDRDAAVVTETVAGLSKADAMSVAEAKYAKASWDGFEGTIKGYGIPRAQAGDTLIFTSARYPERNGRYLAEKITIRYSESGFERDIKIGFRL